MVNKNVSYESESPNVSFMLAEPNNYVSTYKIKIIRIIRICAEVQEQGDFHMWDGQSLVVFCFVSCYMTYHEEGFLQTQDADDKGRSFLSVSKGSC